MREATLRIVEPEAPAAPGARTRLTRLTLSDFRSYERLDLLLDGRPATLSGPNGAGKTNVLEAISMLGPGRGLRGARIEELARRGGPGGWAVSARLSDDAGDRVLGVGAPAGDETRRIVRIDGAGASGPGALADFLRLMWLTPAQDRLFMEGASERRRFIDRMTLTHDPAHARAAGDYETAMRQRQRLLDDGCRDDRWLAALEMQMAEAGVAVASARRDMASALCAAAIAEGPFPAADLALEGELETALAYAPAADVEDDFAATLKACRAADAAAGRALKGPHRSDLLVTHRDKAMPARACSTGEQKALLIGLVLANARALGLRAGGPPLLLLLDEIAAHLDQERRAALFDILSALGVQCMMTGTEPELFSAWGARAQAFAVADGRIREF
ncbi:MAG: DNA replication/repair protein RecF [Parvularculaceae bacterium]